MFLHMIQANQLLRYGQMIGLLPLQMQTQQEAPLSQIIDQIIEYHNFKKYLGPEKNVLFDACHKFHHVVYVLALQLQNQEAPSTSFFSDGVLASEIYLFLVTKKQKLISIYGSNIFCQLLQLFESNLTPSLKDINSHFLNL